MKLAINLRTRAAALFAMLFLCFGMIGGFTGMANQEGAWSEPFVVAAHASVNDLFADDKDVIDDLNNEKNTNLDTVEDKVRDVAQTVTTILTIISFACLLFWIARLAMSAGNPKITAMPPTQHLLPRLSPVAIRSRLSNQNLRNRSSRLSQLPQSPATASTA